MPIPNETDASFPDQSEVDSGDITMGEMAALGFFHLTGGAVTAQGSPDGTVAVSAGTARVNSSNKTISAGNVSVITGSANPDGTTASAADATLARFSLITLNSSSQLGVIHGTPAGLSPSNDGSYLCVFPAVDKSKLILAAVIVPPAFTTITSSQIIDKRITGSVDAAHDAAHSLTGTNHSAGWGGKGYLPYGLTSTTGGAIAPGANATVLTADSAQTEGIKWSAPTDDIAVTFSKQGTVATTTDATALRWYNDTGRTLTFIAVRATAVTAPTGATLIVDVNKDGTTIYTTQGNRPAIAISGNTIKSTNPDVTTIADGSYLTVNVDQVGSTVAGSDLTVTVALRG